MECQNNINQHQYKQNKGLSAVLWCFESVRNTSGILNKLFLVYISIHNQQ